MPELLVNVYSYYMKDLGEQLSCKGESVSCCVHGNYVVLVKFSYIYKYYI